MTVIPWCVRCGITYYKDPPQDSRVLSWVCGDCIDYGIA